MIDTSGHRDSLQCSLPFVADCLRCKAYQRLHNRPSTPCECVYAGSSPQHHQCATCSLWCRSRYVPGQRSYDDEYGSLMSLQDAGDSYQNSLGILPAFVPSKVEEIPGGQHLLAPWAAIELRKLLTQTTRSAARLSGFALKKYLRARMGLSDDTSLLVLLHGRDNLLERFWQMDRQPFYEQLISHNIGAIMGTTFSVYGEHALRPPAHNLMQLRRHSHVLHELSRYELTYIPNLYLRAREDEIELAAWLRDRTDIRQVARDLSMSKGKRAKQIELEGLMRLLKRTGRTFNVILTGVSLANSRRVMSRLHEDRHTCTIVTSDPILRAIKGRDLSGRQFGSRTTLYRRNVEKMDREIRRIDRSLGTGRASKFPPIRVIQTIAA
jgi:hypothetical protein